MLDIPGASPLLRQDASALSTDPANLFILCVLVLLMQALILVGMLTGWWVYLRTYRTTDAAADDAAVSDKPAGGGIGF